MTAPVERCEQSDLPPDMCAHCRGDQLDTGLGDFEIDYTFTAGRAGPCANCSSRIEPGDQVGVTTDREYVCGRCIDAR